jgi:hypothetical protein
MSSLGDERVDVKTETLLALDFNTYKYRQFTARSIKPSTSPLSCSQYRPPISLLALATNQSTLELYAGSLVYIDSNIQQSVRRFPPQALCEINLLGYLRVRRIWLRRRITLVIGHNRVLQTSSFSPQLRPQLKTQLDCERSEGILP